jgi:hypothetical protein
VPSARAGRVLLLLLLLAHYPTSLRSAQNHLPESLRAAPLTQPSRSSLAHPIAPRVLPDQTLQARKRASLFECLPYVGPEPVLVK